MKTDWQVQDEKNREHLRQALSAGEYYTERDSIFYAECDGLSLDGKRTFVPKNARCKPLRGHPFAQHQGRALLVRFTDPRKHNWFAWIHA